MKRLLMLLLVASGMLFATQGQSQVIVIANPTVKAMEITKNDLKDVFTGNATSLKDGSRVVPILLKGGTAHEEFLQAFIGKSDSTYRAGWRSLVFSGQAAMPKNLDTDAEVVEFVKANAGAIGYIGAKSPHEGVKILTVR